MSYTKITTLTELWEGEMKSFLVDGRNILLLHLNSEVVAYENRCAHQSVPLSTGYLKNGHLVCSAHLWEYDTHTGASVNPTGSQLKKYPVRIDGDDIWVDV